ncbi:hypothetical protein HK097_008202 [Rhizophlyctis rosea]|uniref:CCHC-type domain-containing protein n=1 Tax=Rhizophlyctis rosea TaxID=64517 RepID=A0AAD5SLB2_9FUNG|nr:hypothetical protein HK097_008202 [Rhizophlyctis rosea]
MATNLKVLTVGSLNGRFKEALTKIAGINKKHGPFDLLLCTGDFFGPTVTDDIQALLTGQIKVPISTYIISGKHSLPRSVITVINAQDGQICENLIYLGKYGRTKTAEGLQIAFLSGIAPYEYRPDTTINPSNSGVNPPAPDYADADTHYREEWVAALQAGKQPVDIFLTSEWPMSVWNNSSTTATDILAQKGASAVADLAKALQPRYHFAAGVNSTEIKEEDPVLTKLAPPYFEREPFRNVRGARYPTRFYGLGEFGASNKARWFCAFNIIPMSNMETSKLEAEVPNVTLNPFIRHADTTKRKREAEEPNNNFFYGGDEGGNKRQARERGAPPRSYTCNRCQQKGHWIQDCPEKKAPPEGYICNLCQKPGHFIRDCPENKRYDDEPWVDPALRRDPTQCWFCLSNPGLEKHLIVDVQSNTYVTLAKGSLIEWGGHMLIVPIGHYRSTWHMRKSEEEEAKGSLEEIEEIRGRLTKLYRKMGSVTVGFEMFGGGGEEDGKLMHVHEQVVPIPEELIDEIGPAFQREAEAEGLVAVDDYPEDHTLPFCRVTYPSSSDTSTKDIVEITKIYVPSQDKQDQYQEALAAAASMGTGRRPPRMMNLQFGRLVLANLINRPDRADWKKCLVTIGEETKLAGKMKDLIKA